MIEVPRTSPSREKGPDTEKVRAEVLSEPDEQERRLVVESLNVSTEVFKEAGVDVFSGESSQAYTILATGILEARSNGMEYQTVKDLTVRALKLPRHLSLLRK